MGLDVGTPPRSAGALVTAPGTPSCWRRCRQPHRQRRPPQPPWRLDPHPDHRDGPAVRLVVENGGPSWITARSPPWPSRSGGWAPTAPVQRPGPAWGCPSPTRSRPPTAGHCACTPARKAACGGHRPARRRRHRAGSSAGRGRRHPVRVLVAEDVQRLADDIAEGLRDQGIAADVAYDGADAAAKLDLNPYDVLVLDRDLPGIHGDTICRTITATGHRSWSSCSRRRHPRRPGHRPGPRRRRLPAQALPLPRTRAAHPRPGPPQAHGRAPHPARSRDRTRPAPPHRHPPRPTGRPLGQGIRRPRSPPESGPRRPQRRRPARSGLGRNADPFTKTVQVTISRLRRKLGDPPPIETIPGVGYRITDPSITTGPYWRSDQPVLGGIGDT